MHSAALPHTGLMTQSEFSQPVKHRTEFYLCDPSGNPVGDRAVRGELPALRAGDSLDLHGAEFIVKKVTLKLHPERPDHGEQAEAIMRYEVWRTTE